MTNAFCTQCGARLHPEAKFCRACGARTLQTPTSSAHVTAPRSPKAWAWAFGGFIALLILGDIADRLPNNKTNVPSPVGVNSATDKKPEVPIETLISIINGSYEDERPSPPTDDPFERMSLEKWRDAKWASSRQPKTANCIDDDCYRAQLTFNIMGLNGDTRVAECDFDVDATRKLATPLNGYAKYYFKPKHKRKS